MKVVGGGVGHGGNHEENVLEVSGPNCHTHTGESFEVIDIYSAILH